MQTIHINGKTTSLYYDCGYDGLLILSYKNESPDTPRKVRHLEMALPKVDKGERYRPALNDPEIVLFEKTLQLNRHDPDHGEAGRYPAAQLVHNINAPDQHMAAAHYLDGMPVNYKGRHSWYQRNKDFILQSTWADTGGHIFLAEEGPSGVLDRLKPHQLLSPN